MKRIVALAVAALILTGCVSQHLTDGLQSLVGQNIRAAVARLGYPDAQRTMLGDTIYVWSSSHNVSLPMFNTNTTTGSVGGVPVYGSTTSTTYVPANFNCTIQIATDAKGTIMSYQWNGNMGGCEAYANAVRPRG